MVLQMIYQLNMVLFPSFDFQASKATISNPQLYFTWAEYKPLKYGWFMLDNITRRSLSSWGFSDFTMQAAAAFVASFQALDPTLARPALFGGPHWCHPHSTSTGDLTNPWHLGDDSHAPCITRGGELCNFYLGQQQESATHTLDPGIWTCYPHRYII